MRQCGRRSLRRRIRSRRTYEIVGAFWAAQPEEADQLPIVDRTSPDAPASASLPPTIQAREAVPAGQGRAWSVALIGGGGVAACVLAMVVVQSLQPAASEPPPAAAAPAVSTLPTATPVAESAPAPSWIGNRHASWANDGSKTISFELRATNDVAVWMARVRPLLIVRCLYRTTEVFVAIKSAASIEEQAGSHTVRLQIDDEPEFVQLWSDSVTGQELFAPHGIELVRRLASAERLRFSFSPYNAKPVTAEFSVQGFEKLAGLVGRTCGWTLDDSRS